MKTWSVADSLKLYNIENWGNQYFNINSAGNIQVHPRQGHGAGVDIMRVIEEIKQRNLKMPVLIRFQDIIRHRVISLNEAFKKAIKEAEYQGHYQGVYPIKVNQMREVVEEILDAGEPYNFGLEAGSKPELAAVTAMDTNPDALIICNGYKDYDFIKTALMGLKLGKKVVIVVEKLSELHQILKVSKELKVKPIIGFRCKLYSRGSGKWESSGGENAKFGLTTPEILYSIDLLKKEGLEDCFKLLHFHIGSQVTHIRTINDAVREAARIYSKLTKMGLEIDFLDVGGGLGVDYDGSRTNFESSINYSLSEYVDAVVYGIKEICQAEKVKEPHIVSESGRALVAHHSVLIVDVFGKIKVGSTPFDMKESKEEADVVKEIRYIYENLSNKNLLEHFHDALQRKEEAITMFNLGILSLEDRAKVEHIFWQICKNINKNLKNLKYVPEELLGLNRHLADQYLCNFSVFQSMLDHWAIRHLFPIIPISRLNEKPSCEATLADITCDSDGKIDQFVDLKDIKDTLSLHELNDDPYYLGFFLMGAYQDIMGDLHNLFGRVNEVHVFIDETEPEGYYIEEVIKGNTTSDVLSLIQYSSQYLQKKVKEKLEKRVREGLIRPKEGVDIQNFYENLLNGYTYVDYQKMQQSMMTDNSLNFSNKGVEDAQNESGKSI